MADLSNVRNLNLKIIFLVHILFISLVCMGWWSTNGYLFYNSILIVSLLWAIYSESDEPVQLAIVINILSILLDIFLLVFSFPGGGIAREKFSAAMAVLHLLCRPISVLFLRKVQQERNGTGIDLFGRGRNQSYEDMDRSTPPTQSQPPQGGYDFTSAQQI